MSSATKKRKEKEEKIPKEKSLVPRKKGEIVPKEQVEKSEKKLREFKRKVILGKADELLKKKGMEEEIDINKVAKYLERKGKAKTNKLLDKMKKQGKGFNTVKKKEEIKDKIKEELDRLGHLGDEIESNAEIISAQERGEFELTAEGGRKAFRKAIEDGIISDEKIIKRLIDKEILDKKALKKLKKKT